MRSLPSGTGRLKLCVMALGLIVMVAPARAQEKLHDIDAKQTAALAAMEAAQKEVDELIGDGESFGDENARAELGPRVLPALRRSHAASQVILTQYSASKNYDVANLAMLAYFGDAETAKALKKDAEGTEEFESVSAQSTLLLRDWWISARDAVEQKKVADRLKVLARGHPESEQISIAIWTMRQTAASSELRENVIRIVLDELKGQLASSLAPQLRKELILGEMVGKPMVISGLAVDGTKFTTADWKGRVVLVDFWATWCGPCKRLMPDVRKAYADYHNKGLEIVGVSCDEGAGRLNDFIKKNEMPWPELFDPAKPGWHQIATEIGVFQIPTVLLIDRQGILRTASADKNMDKEVQKLLSEKPPGK